MAVVNYESLADVPDDLKEYAKEVEGKVQVKVAPAERIVDFRERNIALQKEKDEVAAKLGRYEIATGVNVPEIEKLDDFVKVLESLRETESRVKAGKLVEDTSLEEALQARMSETHSSYRTQLAELAKDRDAHKTQAQKAKESLDRVRIENAIRLVAGDQEVGMLEGAVKHILPEAYSVFRIEENGKIVPKQPDGTILYGSDGVSPMSIKEWLQKEREHNEYLFKGARGGGASGGDPKLGGRITAAELERMTPSQRIAWARKNNVGT